MAKKSTAIDVTQGVIWQQLLSLCVPIFFSSFFQQAYTLIGTYIVGQFGGKLALGGIQATMVLTELCIGFCVGVGAGCAVITGQFFGQHDDERLSRSIHTAMTLALVGGIVVSILGIVLVEPMLVLMNTPHELLAEGVAYARCYFAAMFAALLLNMGTALLRAVGDTGVERIFFTSSHPKDLLPETIDAMAETPAVMPQLHLAVQSGSTRILKEMNRRYTREDYLGLVDRIRNRMPDIALSTDIIVGFPGETEEDFEQTLSLAETVRYAQAYTFIYSKRAGTPAAEIDDPTPHEVILERFNRLVKVIETTAHEYNQGELHTVVPALIEGTSKKNDAVLLGKSPKNQTVHAPIPEGYSIDQLVGKIVDVDVDVAKTWYLSGSVVGEPR